MADMPLSAAIISSAAWESAPVIGILYIFRELVTSK